MEKNRLKIIKRGTLFLALAGIITLPAAAYAEELVPMGSITGISISSLGAVITGIAEDSSPAAEAGLLPGDVIVAVGSESVFTSEDAARALRDRAGEKTPVTILRGGAEKQLTVTPGADDEGHGTLGVWLRDTVSGIGTVTYYDPESGEYGALGHPVSDTDTGITLPLRSGVITEAKVTDIIAGRAGEPGQLCGDIDLSSPVGVIDGNTAVGIYGRAMLNTAGKTSLPVASKSEIKTGEASVLTDALGDADEYSAEITRIYSSGDRELMIRITDERLLSASGGIVQGMSGSPVIQNGKLVGAVTHVLVNDPSRGYGVSIERMLSQAEEINAAA